MKKFFVIASLVATSLTAGQSGTADACDGHRRIYQACQSATVVQPVVQSIVRSEAIVVQPAPSAVVITPSVPAATAIITPKAIRVPQGAVLRLKANFLGQVPGRVFLFVNSLTLECEVVEWDPNYVIIHLPNAGVIKDTAGKLLISTQEGVLKRKVDVIVAPTPDVEVVPNDEFIPKAPAELLSGN
ncbi:MAG: hypothetical protein ACK6DC_03935 [Planctomycetota bacterium]